MVSHHAQLRVSLALTQWGRKEQMLGQRAVPLSEWFLAVAVELASAELLDLPEGWLVLLSLPGLCFAAVVDSVGKSPTSGPSSHNMLHCGQVV